MQEDTSPKNSAGQVAGGDWFLPAIESSGDVGTCLDAVLTEISQRQSFTSSIKDKLQSVDASSDSISALKQKARTLDSTLKVRLGVLSPEREAAWFRASSTHTAGPFAPALLSQAVLFPYDSSDVNEVRKALRASWNNKKQYPKKWEVKGQCLWSMLLQLNWELENITKLNLDFGEFRLDTLPQRLPSSLESRSLRAFLTNVCHEITDVKRLLAECYKRLFRASETFWNVQQLAESEKQNSRSTRQRVKNDAADDAREKFRQRRKDSRKSASSFSFGFEAESLRFMGFIARPEMSELKRRYIELAKKHHPDRAGGDEEVFKKLTKAYEHLSSRTARL